MEQGEAVRRREAEKRKNEARRRRQKKRKRQQMFARSVMVLTGAVFVGVILYGGWRLSHRTAQAQEEIVAEETKYIADRPDFSVELLDYNEYSRPGTALEKVNGIVVHYTANPGTTAQQNRDYFEGLAQSLQNNPGSAVPLFPDLPYNARRSRLLFPVPFPVLNIHCSLKAPQKNPGGLQYISFPLPRSLPAPVPSCGTDAIPHTK